MADSGSGGGAIGILGVIVGAALVLGLGFFLWNGTMGNSKTVDVNIKPPVTTGSTK